MTNANNLKQFDLVIVNGYGERPFFATVYRKGKVSSDIIPLKGKLLLNTSNKDLFKILYKPYEK